MRAIQRPQLDLSTRLILAGERRHFCDDASTARGEWTKFRRRNAAIPIIETLRRMAGPRGRCFYCCDSLASDVEHFRPIALDCGLTFSWTNMLWICPTCNRMKNDQGPIQNGLRVLVDPTLDDPWRHMTLASPTGILAPRFLTTRETDLRGEMTLKILSVLNYEEVAEGRARRIRELRDAVRAVVSTAEDRSAEKRLATVVAEDEHGVARWFARWEGGMEDPFTALREMPRAWRRFVRLSIRGGR
jgi:uncharacterized protein (TIGR02646 family)